MGAARPGLLPVQDPAPITPFGAGSQAGEVAAGVGLAEPLAEDELAAEDLFDVGLALPGGPVDEKRGRQQADPEAPQDDWCAGLRHLLLVDGLHDRSGPPPAGFRRPGELQPAGFEEAALPLPLQIAFLLFAVTPDAPVAPLLREVAIEPLTDLPAEGFLFSAEAEIH